MLCIFVEGLDDERLLKKFFSEDQGNFVKYSTKSDKYIRNYLRSLKQSNLDYLFFADADELDIEEKEMAILEKYQDCEKEKIRVVKFEIESWYIAGINQKSSSALNLKYLRNTDDFTKEQFNGMIPKQFKGNRIDFMLELIKCFDNDEAISKNKSFKMFFEKYKQAL